MSFTNNDGNSNNNGVKILFLRFSGTVSLFYVSFANKRLLLVLKTFNLYYLQAYNSLTSYTHWRSEREGGNAITNFESYTLLI